MQNFWYTITCSYSPTCIHAYIYIHTYMQNFWHTKTCSFPPVCTKWALSASIHMHFSTYIHTPTRTYTCIQPLTHCDSQLSTPMYKMATQRVNVDSFQGAEVSIAGSTSSVAFPPDLFAAMKLAKIAPASAEIMLVEFNYTANPIGGAIGPLVIVEVCV